MKSGYYGTNGSSSVVYRGIEDFYGNAYVFLDGINIKDNVAYISQDPTQYASNVFSNTYVNISYTLGATTTPTNIANLGFDTNYPSVMLPGAVSSSSQLIPDSAYGNVTGNRVVRINAAEGDISNIGLFNFTYIENSDATDSYTGIRILRYRQNL